ncbi:N-acetylmuramoyl-L-alanine amidase [Patescibacteria group bacterium]|nr:N-acetylmuramoyl-L-alanine amidase [Patescibacteria group bacterium]
MKRRFLELFILVLAVGGWYAASQFYSFAALGRMTMSKLNTVMFRESAAVSNPSAGNAVPADPKTRVLIVPGHEPDYGGAQFGNIDERNLVAEIGGDLDQFLLSNNRYQVFITRGAQAWNPIFADYFAKNWASIVSWEQASKKNGSRLAALGSNGPVVKHHGTPTDVALRLYGITKWANENNIDLMIHLHLNDYPGHSSARAGKYSGLVIYTPADQYNNGSKTEAVAKAVFKRLSLYNPIDNLPVESRGIIDDPELIAVGANNTADAASMLIEYDYIYEPQFVNPAVRSLALKDLAYQTYLGLDDYFNRGASTTVTYDPKILYDWRNPVSGKNANPEDIYALQTALIMDGDYPPSGKSKNDCPHSGTFGACTAAALSAFQRRNGITDEGIGGVKTFELLRKIYQGS